MHITKQKIHQQQNEEKKAKEFESPTKLVLKYVGFGFCENAKTWTEKKSNLEVLRRQVY